MRRMRSAGRLTSWPVHQACPVRGRQILPEKLLPDSVSYCAIRARPCRGPSCVPLHFPTPFWEFDTGIQLSSGHHGGRPRPLLRHRRGLFPGQGDAGGALQERVSQVEGVEICICLVCFMHMSRRGMGGEGRGCGAVSYVDLPSGQREEGGGYTGLEMMPITQTRASCLAYHYNFLLTCPSFQV